MFSSHIPPRDITYRCWDEAQASSREIIFGTDEIDLIVKRDPAIQGFHFNQTFYS